MDDGTNVGGGGRAGAARVDSACAACGGNVLLHLFSRTTQGPQGSMGAITYADTDIAVWDCPACGFANADAFGE
jgi:hypothetical protein